MSLSSPGVIGLVLGVGLGVLLPWRIIRRRRARRTAKAYLKGFHYVLSDTPDAAIEEMTRAVEEEAGANEIYLALGALFRRKGDHERAVRLHQNMLARPFIDPWLREQIGLELAIDYHQAGLTGRAIEAYRHVAASPSQRSEALSRLRQLFEERLDFARAAEVEAERVRDGVGSTTVLAHLLAEAALREEDRTLARRFAEKAIEAEPTCGHAAWACGLLALRSDKSEDRPEAGMDAGAWFEKACLLDRELAPRIAEPLVDLRGEGAAAFFIDRVAVEDHPAWRHALARCARKASQVEVAASHLRRALELDPCYAGARIELGTTLLGSGSTLGAETRRELEQLLKSLSSQETAFACRECGAGYPDPVFRCLQCGGWGTVTRGHRETI